jgi:hypothetical protein
MDKKDYPRAEQLFRDVVRRLSETLLADNVNTGIAHIKLAGPCCARSAIRTQSQKPWLATKS